MNGSYEYTPYLWPIFASIVFLVAMSLYSWHRRNVPGAIPYALVSLSNAVFMLAAAFEIAAVSEATRIFWFSVRAGIVLVPMTAMLCFAIQYAGLSRHFFTRRALIFLSIPPLLLMLSALTNNAHRLLWTDFIINGYVQTVSGPIEWGFVIYAYLLSVAIIGTLVWLAYHSPAHRLSAALVICGVVITRLAYAVDMAGINPVPQVDIISASMVFAAGVYAAALFGFRMFDPVAVAHKLVIAQMQDGILVLDSRGNIVSLNPAAERIFGSSSSEVKGHTIQERLSNLPNGLMGSTDGTEIEVDLNSGKEARHYTLTLSHLKDWRSQDIGRLLMLRDITRQKQAQAQLLEQQRALATHTERERLARELHDGLGQSLAATHLQASTAKMLFSQGAVAQTSECLDILANTTLQAEADMREYLLGTQAVLSVDTPFFMTLRTFLGRFSRQYTLPIELSVPPELEAHGLPQTTGIQLLRIIQEALSNVRKHARASSAQITFTVVDDVLQIAICDNGQGFKPAATAARLDGGYGLRSMSERAAGLGGSVGVVSYPDRGTQVIVKLPVPKELKGGP